MRRWGSLSLFPLSQQIGSILPYVFIVNLQTELPPCSPQQSKSIESSWSIYLSIRQVLEKWLVYYELFVVNSEITANICALLKRSVTRWKTYDNHQRAFHIFLLVNAFKVLSNQANQENLPVQRVSNKTLSWLHQFVNSGDLLGWLLLPMMLRYKGTLGLRVMRENSSTNNNLPDHCFLAPLLTS